MHALFKLKAFFVSLPLKRIFTSSKKIKTNFKIPPFKTQYTSTNELPQKPNTNGSIKDLKVLVITFLKIWKTHKKRILYGPVKTLRALFLLLFWIDRGVTFYMVPT